jgi:hypothetical protein
MYMLDTNMCIYIIKKKTERVLKELQSKKDAGLSISAITLDLFNNPVGCLTSRAVFQAKALQNCDFSGCCLETEVSKQLYWRNLNTRMKTACIK